jgi:hypothetical protein
MPGLEDIFRSAVPGGKIGKPLILALLALLASGALFGVGVRDVRQVHRRSRKQMKALGAACSEAWADCWASSRRADWAIRPIRGSAPGKISRCRRVSSVPRLALTSSKRWPSAPAFQKMKSPSNCRKFCLGSWTN